MPVFRWDEKKIRAAQLCAERRLTEPQIAEQVGVAIRTLVYWKAAPVFKARVEQLTREFAEAVRQSGLAILENRVAALNDRWLLMQQVIDERGKCDEMQAVPGGKTGLLVHTVKGVGRGEDFQLIDLYEVDTGLLNELRQHEKQAAQELGQWEKPTAAGLTEDPPVGPDGQKASI